MRALAIRAGHLLSCAEALFGDHLTGSSTVRLLERMKVCSRLDLARISQAIIN